MVIIRNRFVPIINSFLVFVPKSTLFVLTFAFSNYRSFCRFKPPSPDAETGGRCRERSDPLFYYDVEAAACLSFHASTCTRSRNMFVSEESCLTSCVVEGLRAEEEE